MHDSLGWLDDESKIVRMHGSLSWGLRKDALEYYHRVSDKLQKHSSSVHSRCTRLGVLLGGGDVQVSDFVRHMEQLKEENVCLDIVASRRTPTLMLNQLKSLCLAESLWAPDQASSDTFVRKNANPYRRILATCDAFLVSSDSISMIADVICASSERQLPTPIFLLPTSTTRSKHKRFILETDRRFSALTGKSIFHTFQSAADVQLGMKRGPIVSVQYEADRVATKVLELLNLSCNQNRE
jgi:mitochondrial fission protein ELM1